MKKFIFYDKMNEFINGFFSIVKRHTREISNFCLDCFEEVRSEKNIDFYQVGKAYGILYLQNLRENNE